MAASLCRWGILGTASIARKNWKAIRNAENSTLTAVASRDLTRARQFIDECQAAAPQVSAPAACGSYEELLRREDVDAVYIPLPTAVRKEWVLRAAAAGKHVLCEKPCGVTSADVREMVDACHRHRVQFMDGVMFMHSRRLPLLRQVVEDGETVGSIRRIASQFSFRAPDEFLRQNIRVQGDLEPLGCLGDLGWYNVRLTLWIMNEQLPERVTGQLLGQHAGGVPTEFSGELFFADGVTASFYCSFLTEHQQWANISGTRGYVHLSDFVLPFFGSESSFAAQNSVFHVEGCDFNMESHPRRFAVREYSNGTPDAQETNMVRTFADLVRSGPVQSYWGEIALKTQQVVDACLRSARSEGKSVPVLS